jgi:hypothetical protein
MKDDPVPPTDHISRYCKGTAVLPDGRVSATAFYLGVGHEYLSVNWLEFLELDGRQAEIAEVRKVLATKLNLRSSARIAVLNVGEVREYVRNESADALVIRILHRPDEPPEKPDPSHSGIFDTDLDEPIITELIAEKVVETYPAA